MDNRDVTERLLAEMKQANRALGLIAGGVIALVGILIVTRWMA